MTLTKSHIGSLCIPLTVIFLYCLPATADAGSMQIVAPKITEIFNVTSGKKLTVSCKVNPGSLSDETLVYWLVNSTFLEMAFPPKRVKMITHEFGDYIQSEVVFNCVHFQDKWNDLTCVALSPAGMDTKTISLHEIKNITYSVCGRKQNSSRRQIKIKRNS